MAKADPLKKPICLQQWMVGHTNKMTHYFIEWSTPSGVLKKIYNPYKKFDASKGPLNSSCS